MSDIQFTTLISATGGIAGLWGALTLCRSGTLSWASLVPGTQLVMLAGIAAIVPALHMKAAAILLMLLTLPVYIQLAGIPANRPFQSKSGKGN